MLFQDLISSSVPAQTEDNGDEYQKYVGDSKHINPLTNGKFSSQTIRTWKLPTKMSQVSVTDEFFRELQDALTEYGHKTILLGSKPLYWYNQLSFQDP